MNTLSVFLTHTPEDLRLFYHPEALAALRAIARVVVNPTGRHLPPAELLQQAAGCQVILSEWATGGDRMVFEAAPELVAFIRCGVEIRNVDVEAATANGVLVVTTPGHYVAPVVELVVAFMICLARDLVNRCVALRGGQLPRDRFGTELCGKTLGLVGYGDIARRLAEVALGLGMRVCYTDPYIAAAHLGVTRLPAAQLLAESDFVSLHAKWTPETEGMMDAAAFGRMKPSAYFINTARGALVDEAALYQALSEGRLAGAALDVFASEPDIAGNRLLGLPNVIATPHIGGITHETMRAQALRTVDIVRDLLAGKIPAGTVNGSARWRATRGARPCGTTGRA